MRLHKAALSMWVRGKPLLEKGCQALSCCPSSAPHCRGPDLPSLPPSACKALSNSLPRMASKYLGCWRDSVYSSNSRLEKGVSVIHGERPGVSSFPTWGAQSSLASGRARSHGSVKWCGSVSDASESPVLPKPCGGSILLRHVRHPEQDCKFPGALGQHFESSSVSATTYIQPQGLLHKVPTYKPSLENLTFASSEKSEFW